MTSIVCEAANNGRLMRLHYAKTCGWKAFSVEGLPPGMTRLENKRQSLASAVAAWNKATGDPSLRLELATVSEKIKALATAG